MDFLEPINGVSLEQYAKLCALMTDTKPEETDKHAEIAAANGVNKDDWEAAKNGWTERMQNPEYALKLQEVFMPAYQEAQAAARGGGEPCTMEHYAEVKAEMMFGKDPDNPEQKIDFNKVLEKHDYTVTKWGEMENYWGPRVAGKDDPRTQQFFDEAAAARYKELITEETKKYNS